MKKLSLIPLALVTLIGVVFAATLLPDNSTFPRIPKNPGTIGGALYGLFNPVDGSAKNTKKLAGTYASGYLQNKDCSGEPINTVWVGVDTAGKGICGHLITPLASIGKFTDIVGGVLVKKGGIGAGTPANLTDDLEPGDIIVTGGGTATITFTDDLSILRLDVATVVELSTGENTSGQSVAQAILSDGRLWGRILTSTGINLGGGGMVAGVRGTSVSVEKEGAIYHLSIPHSISSSAAAIVTCPDGTHTREMSPGDILNSSTGCDGMTPFTLPQLYADLWIAENTRKDLVYLDTIVASSTRIADEITATDPIEIESKRGACGSILSTNANTPSITGIWDTLSNSCITGFADYSSNEDTAFHIGNANIPMTNGMQSSVLDDGHFCDYPNQLWGKGLVNTDSRFFTKDDYNGTAGPYNQGDRDKLKIGFPGIQEQLDASRILVVNKNGCFDTGLEGAEWNKYKYPNGYYYYDTANRGIYITGSTSIQYATTFLPSLAGKTITIELADSLVFYYGTSQTLLTLSSTSGIKHIYNGTNNYWICTWRPAPLYECTANDILISGSVIKVMLPSSLNITSNMVYIGNVISGNSPLNAIIKKISIF